MIPQRNFHKLEELTLLFRREMRAIRFVDAVPDAPPLLPRKWLAPVLCSAAVVSLWPKEHMQEVVSVAHVAQAESVSLVMFAILSEWLEDAWKPDTKRPSKRNE